MNINGMGYIECPFCGSLSVYPACKGGRYGHFVTAICECCGAKSKSVAVKGCDCIKEPCSENEFCKYAENAERAVNDAWNRRTNKEANK